MELTKDLLHQPLPELMDLLFIRTTEGNEAHGQEDFCHVHPDTLVELRVPALGLIAVQDKLLLGGAKLYLRCLPCEAVPQGSIRLDPSLSDQVSVKDLCRVHVEGIHGNQYCELDRVYRYGYWTMSLIS